MSRRHSPWAWAISVLVVCGAVSGCATTPKGPQTVTLEPTREPAYRFLQGDELLKDRLGELYGEAKGDQLRLAVYVGQPVGEHLAVNANPDVQIAPKEQAVTLLMSPGVYPFSLKADGGAGEDLTGAVAVFNVTKTLELATFGHTEETQVFNPDLVQKAREGVLTNYTVSFDGEPRLVYWLGNRQEPFLGGEPTVELDFSKNDGLDTLMVNGEEQDAFVVTLPVYENVKEDGQVRQRKCEHSFALTMADGRKFRGYIQNLSDNAYTAFVKVPCEIPDSLYQAASRGTIAKFTVYSEGEAREAVAELVFGMAQ